MNWSTLPPLAALRAFAAFAQTGSMTAAGAELNVTHAAISQQIRQLETHLNVSLLERNGKRVSLTSDGQILANSVNNAFTLMFETVQQLSSQEEERPLQISCTSSFAAVWLMPRLANFRQKHPDISMMIDPNPNIVDLSPGGIDVAIRYGTGPWPGHESHALIAAPLALVGTTELVQGYPRNSPETYAELPWLNEFGTNEASRWMQKHGISTGKAKSITNVPGNLVLEGIRSGQGVAMITRMMVEDDINAGRITVLFEEDSGASYHLVTRPGVQRPALRAFCRWILAEAAKT
ncbi:MAG: LysR family transcriptional regulator [Pelagimonas sp.]|uniref:LysR family transcriptional regulator n=1 Tax=Pelagimonas sp. TaxID=2073170 RepID=UPI003D6BB8CA